MNEVFKCAQTGESLKTLQNVILDQWERRVREVISRSQHESSIVLRDHVPNFLTQLVNILKTGSLDEMELGKNHGFYRSTMTDFSLSDLMTEFSLLRETLMTYLYPMGDMECAKLIHKFLDTLTKYSVVQFLNDQITNRSLSYQHMGNESKELNDNPGMETPDH